MNAQNLQSSVEASWQFQLLVQDGYQQICRHGDPNLGFHCIQACSIVMLYPQIAIDPFEKRLDVPTLLVEFGNRQSRKPHVVGQEHQKAFLLCIEKPDSPQGRGEVFSCLGKRQIPHLIASQARRFAHRTRFLPSKTQVALGACYEKRPRGRDAVKSCPKAGRPSSRNSRVLI
jgi:hypothetical protein